MNQSQRKLTGALLFVVLLVAYPLLVAVLFGPFLATLPWWGAIPLFAVLGLLWFVPAAALIRWMAKPNS